MTLYDDFFLVCNYHVASIVPASRAYQLITDQTSISLVRTHGPELLLQITLVSISSFLEPTSISRLRIPLLQNQGAIEPFHAENTDANLTCTLIGGMDGLT